MKRLYRYIIVILLMSTLVTYLCYYQGIENRKLLKKYVPVNFVIPFVAASSSNSSSNSSHDNYTLPTSESPTSESPSKAFRTNLSDSFSFTGLPSVKLTPNDQTCEQVIHLHNVTNYKRYVMALSYWEQLTMAATSLCGLTAFSKAWSAKTVAPFVHKAEFWGLPSTNNYPMFHGMPPLRGSVPTKPLDFLFNMTKFNSQLLCGKYSIPPLATFDEFLTNADRSITLLHFNFNAYGTEKPNKSFFKNQTHINCLNMFEISGFTKKLLSALNTETDKRGLPSFHIDSACCVNHSHITTPQEIIEKCGLSKKDSFTIVNTVWRGFSGIVTKFFRLIVPQTSLDFLRHPGPSIDVFPLNDKILYDSYNYYRDLTIGGKDFLAIHIRTAKIAMLNFRGKRRFLSSKCMSIMWELISKIRAENLDLPAKYFVDYGPYGSHSFEISLGKKITRGAFLRRNISPLHYDPLKYGGFKDQGYVSLVEQNTIAMSKVLVLIGGGSFQEQILNRFKLYNKGGTAYKACWSKEELEPQTISLQ